MFDLLDDGDRREFDVSLEEAVEIGFSEQFLRTACAKQAYHRIDAAHAQFMRDLTGSATVEERDTWVSKSEAARFVLSVEDAELEAEIALVASGHVDAMDDLATLIFDVGAEVEDVRALAAVVNAKSLAYKKLIGMASRVRREARAAIDQATAPAVLLEDVPGAIAQVEAGMMQQVAGAVAEWQAATG